MSEKELNRCLETRFLGKLLKSPLLLPAGIMDMSYSGLLLLDKMGAGIVTSKSLTLEPRIGHKGPVVAEFPGGILNCMGLCNPGIEEGLQEIKEFRKRSDTPVIVSVFATSGEDFVRLVSRVNKSEADFLELNLSCPNVFDEFGVPLSASPGQVAAIVKAVKKVAAKPVIAKLSPNVLNIVDIARAAADEGSDALCLINTVGPGMLIDIHLQKPVLFNKFGGLSGPCIKPVALKMIYQVSCGFDIPIIGMGGVMNGEDAVEMMMAGADLVGIGSAVYYDGPEAFSNINSGILKFLKEKNYREVSSIPKLKNMTDSR